MVTCGSHTGTGNDQDTNAFGLPYNHAFSVLTAIKVTKANGSEVRLVMIRNPWGSESFSGRWSDNDANWDASSLK